MLNERDVMFGDILMWSYSVGAAYWAFISAPVESTKLGILFPTFGLENVDSQACPTTIIDAEYCAYIILVCGLYRNSMAASYVDGAVFHHFKPGR